MLAPLGSIINSQYYKNCNTFQEETDIITYETDSDQLRMYPNVSSMQVVDESEKSLDLLNMTLIK